MMLTSLRTRLSGYVWAAFLSVAFLTPAAAFAQSGDDLEVRWSQIPGPSIVGHTKPVGVGLAGNGDWITTRAYVGGNVSAASWDIANKSRFFGNPDSIRTFDDQNLFYTPLAEIDAKGTIYALFNQASVSRISPAGLDVYIGTKHLGTGFDAYNASLAKDLGVNDDGVLWRIGVEKGPGGSAIDRYDAPTDRWERISGYGVRIDVDPAGLPWVVNDLGDIWHWDGAVWTRVPGKATDIAVGSDGVVWIIEAEGRMAGRASILSNWDKTAKQANWEPAADLPNGIVGVNIAAGRRGEAIMSDSQGRLWRAVPDVRDPARDENAVVLFDPARATDIAASGPVTADTSQADRTNLDLTNGGAVSLSFLTGAPSEGGDVVVVDAETAAFLTEGLAGQADQTLADLGIVVGGGTEGCLLSHGSSSSTKLSLCLDATLSNLAVTIARQTINVPVEGISGKPQTLLVRTGPEGVDGDMALRVWLNGTALGPFFLDKQSRVDPDARTKVRIGADTEGKRVFQGRIGSVRVFSDAPDVEALLAAPFAQVAATPALPGYPLLVLDAPLTPEAKTISLMPPSIVPERFWHLAGLDTFKPQPRPATVKAKFGAEMNFAMPDIYRLRVNPPQSAGVPATLTVFRDGESGVTEATFVQTGRNSYRGVRSPVTGQTGTFDLTIERASVTQTYNGQDRKVEVLTTKIGPDRLYSIAPFLPNPEKAAVSDSFAFASMAALAEYNYYGHDITRMSPRPGRLSKLPRGKIFHMFDPSDERSREYTVQSPVVIPWGTNYFNIDQGEVRQTENIASTTREYQDGFGFSLGASVEVPKVAEFSANGAFKTATELMAKEERSAIYSNAWYAYYALVADRPRMALDEAFILAVQDLKDGRIAPKTFLETYGTHYAHGVVYGQRIRFESLVKKAELGNKLSSEWSVGMESKVAVKAVTLGVKAEFDKNQSRSFGKETESRESYAYGEAGGLSNSLEEIMAGDNPTRVAPIAFDLRPIWELMSPLYFDDPAIYQDLRATLQEELYKYAMAEVDTSVLNDVNLMPSILRLQLDRLVPVAAEDSPFYGTVQVVVRNRDGSVKDTYTIWSTTRAEAVTADPAAKGGRPGYELGGVSKDFVGTDAELSGLSFELKVDLKLSNSVDELVPAARTLTYQEFAEPGTQPALISGKSCNCLSACPAGYSADGASCIKDCPNGFVTRGGTCYGSYEAEDTYLAWDMEDCEADWGSCEHLIEGFGTVVPKCKPGFFREFGTFGICIAYCETFGLGKWAGGNATCVRPEASRTTVQMQAGGSCPAGYDRSNKSCPSIELEFKALRLN
ncbi:MAG: hypothetical protein RLZZ528_825 [Pseudomonadota bacterium]